MINFMEMEQRYQINVYPKRDIVLVKGENARVWDERGKEYVDCVAGHGVANWGHGNEKIIAAIHEQAQKLITCSNLFYNDTRALLLEKLVNITPDNLQRAFLCNSGTESVEAAIKFARYSTKKTEFICVVRGFHGRTMGALSATFNPKYREDFQPLLPGFHHVPFNDFEKLREKVNANTAGIILEIVQGEGGVHVGKKEYFMKVRDLCDERRILLIVDEVQTGFCRTGKMFACNHFNLEPDLLCLAKSMAGGLPMGAILCSDKIELDASKHGSTFGGNPLSCAAAIAAIDYMLEHKLDQQAKEKGQYFISQVKSHNLYKVKELRHLGLMIGIELGEEVKPYIFELMNAGVLVLPAGSTVIRLLPPLTIGYEELDFVVEKLVEALK